MRKIIFQDYRCEDVVEFAFHSFKSHQGLPKFLDALLRESKIFSAAVKKKLFKTISRAYSQNSAAPFTKNMARLKAVVSDIQLCFKFLENVNYEIEKLSLTYLKNNTAATEEEVQEMLCLSKKLFIGGVFQEPFVRNFLIQLKRHYLGSPFYKANDSANFQNLQEFLELLELEESEEGASQCEEMSVGREEFNGSQYGRE